MKNKKWIWEEIRYPSFPYDVKNLLEKLTKISENIGQIKALLNLLDAQSLSQLNIDLLTSEIVSTSAIEGELLSRQSVRSSIRKKLDKNASLKKDTSTSHTDALANVLMDANKNDEPLSLARLHEWHTNLLIDTQSTFHKVQLGTFRDYDDMQVISGNIGKEKVHYVGLPHARIETDIEALLEYVNTSEDNFYIKSALAHLWFVTIHPYDDGNGRIARMISDYVLAQGFDQNYKYFSISSAIEKDKKNYYDNLEQSQNLVDNVDFEFTQWLLWYFNMFNVSLKDTLEQISQVTKIAKYWDKVRSVSLNERQLKVIHKLLSLGEGNFDGGLSTKKYIAMTKISPATAKRDIHHLVKTQCLYQIKDTKGRNVRYDILWAE